MNINELDAIYCLHCAENEDRYIRMQSQFKKIGLEDKVTWWWTCYRDISNKVGDLLTEMHTDAYDDMRKNSDSVYGRVFNCAFEHYTIIKSSYLRGMNNILIFEDDIEFCGDKQWFEQVLSKVPYDYDICKLFYGWGPVDNITSFDTDIFERKFVPSSTVAYMMNRIGMKAYINSANEQFRCADLNFLGVDTNSVNFYVNKYQIIKLSNTQTTIL